VGREYFVPYSYKHTKVSGSIAGFVKIALNIPELALMDAGKDREHDCMDIGSRAMQEQLPRVRKCQSFY
jgi:hypothetical protein